MQTVAIEQEMDPKPYLWTIEAYHCMAEAGLFLDKRVQLIEGQVVEMSPMKSAHATGVDLVVTALRQVAGSDAYVREQKPLALSSISEPEPDVAVVSGTIRDYVQEHPTTALLVVEVSDSTLRFDRETKGRLYTEAGIEEYWILNLIDACLEVYRLPEQDPDGYRYAKQTIYQATDLVSLLMQPSQQMAVADLLP